MIRQTLLQNKGKEVKMSANEDKIGRCRCGELGAFFPLFSV